MTQNYVNYTKKLFASILTFIIFIVLVPISLTTFAQGSEETPETEDFKILVKAELGSEIVDGVTFDLTGPGVSMSKSAKAGEEVVFSDLSAGQFQVSINIPEASQYELVNGNASRTVTLTEANQSETVAFAVQIKAPPVDENLENIQAIKFPASLTKVGSSTTDLAKLDPESLGNVENFTFDNPGVNKIIFIEPLDLSNFNEYSQITKISDFLDLETIGKVRFDVDTLRVFDKKAKIFMYQVELADFPEAPVAIISRNGVETTVKDINYDKQKKELSFVVDGFSTYSLSPRVTTDYEELLAQTSTTERPSDNVFETDKESVDLTFITDNLKSTVNVTNNGVVVNFPTSLDNEGKLSGTVKLAEGNNRIKALVKLPNGEENEEFITIKYTSPEESANDVSNVFGVVFFILILVLGLGALGYIYYKNKKSKVVGPRKGPGDSRLRTVLGESAGSPSFKSRLKEDLRPGMPSSIASEAETLEDPAVSAGNEAENTPKYDEDLLTEEEKKLYNVNQESDRTSIEDKEDNNNGTV